MAQMTGADVDDLEGGAARLEAVGSQIGGMRRPLRSQLYSSHWEGRAAERFRNRWDTVHGPALSDAEAFLHSAGRLLRAEADEQRRASNMGGDGARRLYGLSPIEQLWGGDRYSEFRGWFGDQMEWLKRLEEFSLPISVLALTSALLTRFYGTAIGLRDVSRLNLDRFARAFKRVPKPLRRLGTFFDLLTAATSGYGFIRAVQNGDTDTAIRRGVDIGWVVASKHPYVAAGKTAWDVGWEIGLTIDHHTGFSDYWSDRTMESTITREYGGELTPKEAAQYSKRYDGPTGMLRYIGDWMQS